MEAAVVQSLLSSITVMKRGCGRFRVDVDTSGITHDMTHACVQ